MKSKCRVAGRELDLARVSSSSLHYQPKYLSRALPASCTQRISLYPGLSVSERSSLLAMVTNCFESHDLVPSQLVQVSRKRVNEIATDEASLETYLAESAKNGSGWPGGTLIWNSRSAGGAVMTSDLDRMTLLLDFWGDSAMEICNATFEVIWAEVKNL